MCGLLKQSGGDALVFGREVNGASVKLFVPVMCTSNAGNWIGRSAATGR
jgi:hypothetical protein